MIAIYIDADACPVKEEAVRVAARHGIAIHFVSNSWMRLPEGPLVQRVMVPEGPDKADDWIAERADRLAIVVTGDIPLAARCVKTGARVTTSSGKRLSDANIGTVLATRNLMQGLREANVTQTYNAGFTRQDRSQFLQTLELLVQEAKRSGV